MCPNQILKIRLVPRHQHGVGVHVPSDMNARTLWWFMFTLCVGIRVRRRVPISWNTSIACQVPKPGKALHPQVCMRDRLIHVLDKVCKSYFAHLIRKKVTSDTPPVYTTMTHGYLRHRRRENAVGCLKTLKHRLLKVGITHSLTLADLSNVFCSMSHEQTDAALSDIVCAEDRDIAQTRYTHIFFVLDTIDGTLSMQPFTGGLQGDVFMVWMWLSSVQPVVAKWQCEQPDVDCFARACMSRSPQGVLSDGSVTVYADDVGKLLLHQRAGDDMAAPAGEVIKNVSLSSTSFDECLHEAGISQHRDKTEVIATFCGQGSFRAQKCFDTHFPTAKTVGRHLGSLQTVRNSNASEVAARCRSMWSGYHVLGLFFSGDDAETCQ